MHIKKTEIIESNAMSTEELIDKISQFCFELDNIGRVQKELNVQLEEVENEISQLEAEREYCDDIFIEIAITNDKEGKRNYTLQMSQYVLEDFVQVLYGLTNLILEDENIDTVSNTLVDLSLDILANLNNDNKVLEDSDTATPSTFTWDDFAKPLDTEEFMREQLNDAVSLLSNVTDLLGIPRLSEDDIDRVFDSIIRIYEQHSDSLWTNHSYTEQFKHIKTKNKPQGLKDDLYECTYLIIKRIVLDEVDKPMQDMVLNKIIEISKSGSCL